MSRCDHCRKLKDNVRLREKTLPSFKVEQVRLCTPCARAGGWADVHVRARPSEDVRVSRCPIELLLPPAVPCELDADHDGAHRNGLLLWHQPPVVVVGGEPVDTSVESEHWQDGQVRLSWQEPAL